MNLGTTAWSFTGSMPGIWTAESSSEDFPHGLGKLVGTGRALAAAIAAVKQLNDFLRLSALHEASDGGEIAGTTACERHVCNDAIVDVNVDL